jgi:elongator complex protein 3
MSKYSFEPEKYKKELNGIISELLLLESVDLKSIDHILKRYPKDKNQLFRRDQLVAGIDYFIARKATSPTLTLSQRREFAHDSKELKSEPTVDDLRVLISKIKLKPMRTESGVTTVTVLTKPFACPGECVFCPNDVRMPKSYIATEPGAQRGLANRFSPYLQTWNRLMALKNIGHPTQKIELLVLGGTWSSYPERYQVWFISECFRAMNEFSYKDLEKEFINNPENTPQADDLDNYLAKDYNDELRAKVGNLSYNKLVMTKEFKESFNKYIAEEDRKTLLVELWQGLEKLHESNASSDCRCVGLVLETRPDSINEREVLRLRRLGATKIQLGIQTLDDEISKLNKRGEGRVETGRAFRLLRAGGFKIHAHMMPNLYGATPEIDKKVYLQLFELEDYKPDEVKIYPTSLIKNTELYDYYLEGKYQPYSTEVLIDLMADLIESTPEYCRLSRIIRDIPSTEIEAGNKTTNLREIVEFKLKKEGRVNGNIRAREIRTKKVTLDELKLDIQKYKTTLTTEYFLQYITKSREIAGFLRLSIPDAKKSPVTDELDDCAMIREVHVYGPSLKLDIQSSGEAQHLGLGTKLIEKAKEMVKNEGFEKLAVISAIGTREYYEKRGFELVKYYQIAGL